MRPLLLPVSARLLAVVRLRPVLVPAPVVRPVLALLAEDRLRQAEDRQPAFPVVDRLRRLLRQFPALRLVLQRRRVAELPALVLALAFP